jgi:Raf kinase inhibitor-like YbhB/YbcL family protein
MAVNLKAGAIALLITFATGCARQPQTTTLNPPTAESPQSATVATKLTSRAFTEGQLIPRQYTCDGINISPPLEWSGISKSAKTIAIIADDPDAPAGTWVHWVVYNLPADTIGMVENLPSTDDLKGGGLQGKNDFEKIGYGGPCPPSGTHRYFFKLYALDNELPLKAGATKSEVEKAMSGHVLGQTQLIGTYHR